MFYSGCFEVVGSCKFTEGQLNCSLKCSAHTAVTEYTGEDKIGYDMPLEVGRESKVKHNRNVYKLGYKWLNLLLQDYLKKKTKTVTHA